ADAFTSAREASEVVKANRTSENDVVVFLERAIDFDRRAVRGRAELNHARGILSIVIDGLDSLRDKRREQFALFFWRHRAMNARRKNNDDIPRRNTRLDQTPHEQIDNLRARRRACGIGDDNQDALARRDNLFERRRINRRIYSLPNLDIRQRTILT